MSLPYYVVPQYWLEGYAEGDAKIVAAQVNATLTTAAAAALLISADASTAVAAAVAVHNSRHGNYQQRERADRCQPYNDPHAAASA